MKKIKSIIIILITIHFSFIIISQLRELKILDTHLSKIIENRYILPFFEQNWGMFSPNPPQGNQFIMIKFKTYQDSIVIDPHKNIRNNSNGDFLNLDQRLLKYQAECFNDIIEKNNQLNSNSYSDKKNYGLLSFINYSLFILKNQKSFTKNLKSSDLIYIDLYLIDDILDKPQSKQKFKGRYYTEIKNVFSITKNEFDKLQL